METDGPSFHQILINLKDPFALIPFFFSTFYHSPKPNGEFYSQELPINSRVLDLWEETAVPKENILGREYKIHRQH